MGQMVITRHTERRIYGLFFLRLRKFGDWFSQQCLSLICLNWPLFFSKNECHSEFWSNLSKELIRENFCIQKNNCNVMRPIKNVQRVTSSWCDVFIRFPLILCNNKSLRVHSSKHLPQRKRKKLAKVFQTLR